MKYGLALGGGGARGAFEAGAWRALMELGKEITAVAGTSVGAINGAAFLSGTDCEALWKEISLRRLIPGAAGDDALSAGAINGAALWDILRGGLDTMPLMRLISEVIDENRVRGSGTDYGVCLFSADRKKSEELFLDRIPQGRLTDYVTASACFPLFRPVRIGGRDHVDGGVRNNIPVDMLIERGCDTVISVSVKGPGVVRDTDRRGINIIKIEYEEPECGVMEFDPKKLRRSIEWGYLTTLKAFGRLSGRRYFIDVRSYDNAVSVYGKELVKGIEEAAELAGADRLGRYSFGSLVKGVVNNYSRSPALSRMVGLIESGKQGFVYGKTDILPHFNAANAVIYMKKHKISRKK